MNPAAYLEMAETESTHWWYLGRRAIFAALISRLALPQGSRILEIGCGTGGNLQMLTQFGEVSALEMDANARSIAARNQRYDIRAGRCPDDIPFQDKRFDLICLLDVLEHIDKDTETLIAAKHLLKKNGRILVSVPAYQWLSGAHDEFLHHKRRYSARRLQSTIAGAGLRAIKLTYFNSILFPFAVIARLKQQVLGGVSVTGSRVPPSLLNKAFSIVFGAERFLLEHVSLPFGLSLLCVLEVAVLD